MPLDLGFKDQMISAYRHSINDDPLVRAYLAIAMGATGDGCYSEELVGGITDEARESRLAAIQAAGMVRSTEAVDKLIFAGNKIIPLCFDANCNVNMYKKDGELVAPGEIIAKITAKI